jgi:hypothetical protein
MKVYRSNIDKVNATMLEDNDTFTVELHVKNGDAVRLSMTPFVGADIKRCLTALEDERMAKAAAPGAPYATKARAYYNPASVNVGLDDSGKALLIDFDRYLPARIGVAIKLAEAGKFLEFVQAAMKQAK